MARSSGPVLGRHMPRGDARRLRRPQQLRVPHLHWADDRGSAGTVRRSPGHCPHLLGHLLRRGRVLRSRLYLDPHTFLPIAQETTGQVNSSPGQIQPMRARWVYAHTFVPAHAVPAHFFDPAAIGYVPPENQLNHVPRGFTIYWLGTHVAGVRGLPPLLLTKVDPGGAAGGGYLPILTYS